MPNYSIRRFNTCLYKLYFLSLSYSPSFIIYFFIIYPFFTLIFFLPPCAILVNHNVKLKTFNSIQNLQFTVLRYNVACHLHSITFSSLYPTIFWKVVTKTHPFIFCVCLIAGLVGICHHKLLTTS